MLCPFVFPLHPSIGRQTTLTYNNSTGLLPVLHHAASTWGQSDWLNTRDSCRQLERCSHFQKTMVSVNFNSIISPVYTRYHTVPFHSTVHILFFILQINAFGDWLSPQSCDEVLCCVTPAATTTNTATVNANSTSPTPVHNIYFPLANNDKAFIMKQL